MPTLAIDYMFMHSSHSDGAEDDMPILVTKVLRKDSRGTGMVSASVAPNQRARSQAIRRLSDEVGKLGHPDIV